MMNYNLQIFGGRGTSSRTGASRSSSTSGLGGAGGSGGNQNQTPIANQTPSADNTPVNTAGVGGLANMTDDDLSKLVNASKIVDMPNHLSDVSDATQKFVFMAGLNQKPQVLSKADFDKYVKSNNIPKSQILARSVSKSSPFVVNGTRYQLSAQQINQMTRDSALNYIGGKHGGMVHGAGTYFDMNGGRSTGYGQVTMRGILSKNARIIDHRTLDSQVTTWAKKNPKTAKAIGTYSNRTMSIYALAMGYNVIRSGSYHNIIDRSALVLDSTDY